MDFLSSATISGNASIHKRLSSSRCAKLIECDTGRSVPDCERNNVAVSGVGSEAPTGYRRFRHAFNGNGGIDSICRRCRNVIASSADEWSLLACEEQHVCGIQSSAKKRLFLKPSAG